MTKTRKKKSPRSPVKLSTLDDFLKHDGKLDEFQATAIKEVLAWQIAEAMKANNISRSGLATRMKTSRTQIGRLLDPNDGNVTLATLQRAAGWSGVRCGWNWFDKRLVAAPTLRDLPHKQPGRIGAYPSRADTMSCLTQGEPP